MLEKLESRRLCSVAALDASFGEGGAVIDAYNVGPDYQFLPLPDGRFARWSSNFLTYSKRNGARDSPRNATFSSIASGTTITDAVARSDGSIVLLQRIPALDPGEPATYFLQSFNPDGSVDDTVDLDFGAAFISDGTDNSVLVTAVDTDDQGNEIAVTRRFLSGLTADSDYGDNGTAMVQISADVSNLQEELRAVRSDANGRLYLVYFQERQFGGVSDIEGVIRVRRLTAGGELDSTYGTVQLDRAADLDDGTNGQAGFADVDVRADGTLAALTTREYYGGNSPLERAAKLTVVEPSGVAQSYAFDRSAPTGLVALGAGDDVYVTVRPRDGRLTEIYKFDGVTPDATWSHFGPFASTTTEIATRDLLFTEGRLLLTGQSGSDLRRDLILGVNGTREDFGVAPGRAVLLPDGTVAVNGTRGNDTIVVSSRRGSLIVSLNGATKTFPITSVNGIFITGLAGSDIIGRDGTFQPMYALAGAGDDTLTGSDATDTLIGAEGNDVIYANGGNDDCYGQDGDDVILAGVGVDLVYGGPGKDRLFSSTYNYVSDNSSDTLFGGSGRDIFDRDEPSEDIPSSDDVINSESNDVVVT